MTDREILEDRLNLFQLDSWLSLQEELTELATSLEKIYDIDNEKTLFERRGQLGILNMITNLEESTKYALEQLEED